MNSTNTPKLAAITTLLLSFFCVPTGDPLTIILLAAGAVPLVYFTLRIILLQQFARNLTGIQLVTLSTITMAFGLAFTFGIELLLFR